jgi:glutamate/tyrosine decarboxylase-like PLP-dependent enzyme
MADSFTWDAHKLMNLPLTASLILVKQQSDLEQACAGGGGAYLFHEDENTQYNSGRYSLQCGRRVDALKLWLSWKAIGAQGYAEKVDSLMALKDAMLDQIQAQPELEMLAPAPFLNVLFRYVPPGVTDEQQLAELNVRICKRLHDQDLAFVDYAQYKEQLGIRFILANSDLDQSHIERFLGHCLETGKKLKGTLPFFSKKGSVPFNSHF